MRNKAWQLSYVLWMASALFVFAACDKEDDPDAIDVKNLKYPHSLTITDNGDGSIRLNWQAANFEKDFEGYNVYGMKMSDATIKDLGEKGLVKGQPFQLLDAEGSPSDDAKSVLEEFNYDPEKLLEEAKAKEPSDDAERKISFLPIHNEADDEPILPTCYPTADGDSFKCEAYTEDNVEEVKDEEDADIEVNGNLYYDITGLTPGDQYCFLVFSVQDSGEEISQTSTNFECVRPTIEVSVSLDLTDITGAGANREFKVADYAEACDGTSCPDISTSAKTDYDTYIAPWNDEADASSTGDIYFEAYAVGGTVSIVAGADCGIADLGIQTGLNDSSLPHPLPAYKNEYDAEDTFFNTGGFQPAGASLVMQANHVYLIGCEDSEDDAKSYYHFVYVNQSTSPKENDTSGLLELKIRPGLASVDKDFAF